MEKEEIIKLAKESKLVLSDDEIIKFKKDFEDFYKQLNLLEEFDTDGYKPLFSVLENKVVNRFSNDEPLNSKETNKELFFDEEKMVEGLYQVPNKEGN